MDGFDYMLSDWDKGSVPMMKVYKLKEGEPVTGKMMYFRNGKWQD